MAGLPFLRLMVSHVGRGAARRGSAVSAPPRSCSRRAIRFAKLIQSHCTSAGVLSDGWGWTTQVSEALSYIFERWDGSGMPNGARGRGYPARSPHRSARRCRRGSPAHGRRRTRRSTSCVPDAERSSARRWPTSSTSDAAAIVDGIARNRRLDRDVGTGARSRPHARSATRSTSCSRAMADFVDLKCPCSPGYSRGVADLAAGGGPHPADARGGRHSSLPGRPRARPRQIGRVQPDLEQEGIAHHRRGGAAADVSRI